MSPKIFKDVDDIVDGGSGRDAMAMEGSFAPEGVGLPAMAGHLIVDHDLRDRIDADNIEDVSWRGFGGLDESGSGDAIAVNDMSGTDVVRLTPDFTDPLDGTGPNNSSDTLTVRGTPAVDHVTVSGSGANVTVAGLTPLVTPVFLGAGPAHRPMTCRRVARDRRLRRRCLRDWPEMGLDLHVDLRAYGLGHGARTRFGDRQPGHRPRGPRATRRPIRAHRGAQHPRWTAMTNRDTRAGLGVIGVGAAACAACCAGPLVGFLTAIGVASVVGAVMFGVVGLLAVLAVAAVAWQRRSADKRHPRSATSAVPIDDPRAEARR